ncbi:patatin-like phospholipase family protein [Reyranella sp. CPCC 100927]|uniref:patatin-like phospholipase family protein n=1 Tax=Reyranella sp. CPCC 100927 TaxID=2599616 RepID=UPI0015B4FD80|nr:patatin-like phospholipase family protein [Reyranella sp. CPCC 100927]
MANDPGDPGNTWLWRRVSAVASAVAWIAGHIAGPWWALRDILRLFWACRAPMLSVVIGGALIALTDQARDIVMASAVAKGSVVGTLGLIATMVLWATVSWYWARVTLNFSFSVPPIDLQPGASSVPWRRAAPVIVLALILVALGAALWVGHGVSTVIMLGIIAEVMAFWIAGGGDPERAARWRQWWRRQVPRIIGAAAILAVAVAFWKARDVYGAAGDEDNAARFTWWAGGFVVLAIVFYIVVASRTWLTARLLGHDKMKGHLVPTPDVTHDSVRDYDNPVAFAALGLSLLLTPVLFLFFLVNPVGASDFLGGAVRATLVGLATMVPVLSLLALLSARFRLPLLGTTILWLAVGPWLFGDNHDVRSSARDAGPYPVTGRQEIGRLFQDWWTVNARPEMTQPLAVTADGEDRVVAPPFVVVATAGGASRAAFWTSQVLGEIAAREPGFADRLFMISGVSGGSLGAMVFRSIVEVDRQTSVHDKPTVLKDPAGDARSFIERDFLTPAMAAGLYVDLPWRTLTFLPRAWQPPDRAAALEKAWEAAWQDSIRTNRNGQFSWSDGFLATFSGIGKGDSYRPWPILALNGTSVEKGKRIITSNADFRGGQIANDVNRYDAFDILGRDMPISTAVTMSARFPVISPAGGMRDSRGQDRMVTRIIDGGLYENFGAVTADEILRYVIERRGDVQVGLRPVVPIAIVISSDPSLDHLDRRTGTGYHEPPIPGLPSSPDCAAVASKQRGSVPIPVLHPGNRWPECPVDGRESATILVDPILALYDGRVARGEQAATAMLDRIDENRASVRRQIITGLARMARLSDSPAEMPVSTDADVNRRLGTSDHVDFFHFRQCRVPRMKGPTMSWHDSGEAWRVMRLMTGLEAGGSDPCGNAAEFFRLCVRLARLSGQVDDDKAATAFCETERKWPRPAAWKCEEFGVDANRRWWCRLVN